MPATARAVAHLAAALTAPVGIAAAAVAGGTWPVCVLAGGVLAAVACDVQARRWWAPLLDGACVIAVGLALVGLAALVPVPVGVLATIAAGGLLAIRRDAAAAALAAAAAASPILVSLAEMRIGDGTLARIGATGDVLAWSAPLVGVLAGGVLAVVAGRRNAPAVAVMALSAPLVGVVTGSGDPRRRRRRLAVPAGDRAHRARAGRRRGDDRAVARRHPPDRQRRRARRVGRRPRPPGDRRRGGTHTALPLLLGCVRPGDDRCPHAAWHEVSSASSPSQAAGRC